MKPDRALKALPRGAIAALKLEQGLAFGGIAGNDSALTPTPHDNIVLGRQLGEQTDGLIFIVLLIMLGAIDEKQRDPGVDDDDIGLHPAQPGGLQRLVLYA